MAPRPPRRTRSPRAVTVVHFAKRRTTPPRRATTTKTMPAVGVEPEPEVDEDTAVTAPGEESAGGGQPRAAAEALPLEAGGGTARAAGGVRADAVPRAEAGTRPEAGTRVAAPRGEGLVEVPRESGGRYHPDRVTRLLKGQKPGYPFPPLSDDEVTELACFGRFLFEVGRFEDAQLVLEGLVASGVGDAFPYSMLGTVYLAQRDLNRALALFEAALALAPTDLAAHVYRAEIRLRQGRVDLAVGDLRYALANGDPDDPFTARAEQLRRLLKRSPRSGERRR